MRSPEAAPPNDDALSAFLRAREHRHAQWQAREHAKEQPHSLSHGARARIALRRRTQDEREAKADLNRRLAEALGISLRYARVLQSEGTTQRAAAATMAQILGGEADEYMRRARHRGRRADLVAYFMRVQAEGCAFTDFVGDPPEDLDDDSREMIGVLQARGASDFESLDAFIAFVAALEFESVDVACASGVWRAFKRWRISRVAELACFAVDEGEGLR